MSLAIANRNEAYHNIIDKLPNKRKDVFQMYERHPHSSAWDISMKTMLPINEITARTTELKYIFLIVESGSKINQYSKKSNTTYRAVKNINERIDLVNAAFVKLRDAKDKLINDYHTGISQFSKTLLKKEITKIQSQIKSLDKIFNNGKTNLTNGKS